MKVSVLREQLADREAIRDCLMRYSRGIDRIDRTLLESVYWPDAIDNHMAFTGPAPEFIDYCTTHLKNMDQTQHFLGNMLIEIHGDEANAETYFNAFHRLPSEDGSAFDLLVAGRYVDTMQKRDDEWRIYRRLVLIDWFRQFEDSADWTKGFLGMKASPAGEHYPEDQSYKWFARA